jgi:transposase
MWDLAELAIHIESKYDVIYQSQQSYYSLLKSAKLVGKSPRRKIPKAPLNW